MCIIYDDVLKRLREERDRLGLSQEGLGRFLFMSQSHYSKVELGKRFLGFQELRALCETDLDVNYIYTNRRPKELSDHFLSGMSYYQLYCIMNLVIYYSSAFQDHPLSAYFNYIRFLPQDRDPHKADTFFILRQIHKLSQIEMAERLGMDVKKYRLLETNRIFPDSEALFLVYQQFHIPPAVFLRDSSGIRSEILICIEQLPEQNRSALLDLIQRINQPENKSQNA